MGSYSYSGYLWSPVVVAAFAALLALYGWRRRRVPGALAFSIGCLFAVAWCLGSLFESSAVSYEAKLFWLRFLTVWQLPVVTAATCFVLDYSGLRRWLTPRTIALLAIPPFLLAVVILTDGLQHLMWSEFIFRDGALAVIRAPLNVVFLTYSYLLFVFNIAVLFWLFVRSPRHRAPVALMVVGQVGSRVIFELGTRVGFPAAWDPDPFVLGIVFGLYGVALFRFHAFDPVPAARAAALGQMREGMLVVDVEGHIVDANPAAERTLGQSATKLRGRKGAELLPMIAALTSPGLAATDGAEFEWGEGGSVRHYRGDVSPLRDGRGGALGHLVLLHDMTEEKQAQARLLEEQVVVATYQERERLARELHDGIGQVLGYVGMQAEAARDCCRAGDALKTDSLLTRLIEVAHRSHADLRHSILALKATPTDGSPFLRTLENYLNDFGRQYGVQTQLDVADSVSVDTVGRSAAAQILRVIQEALSNTRHAEAHNVRLTVQRRDGWVYIEVADDGGGFDATSVTREPGQHFGLAFMNERMEQIGGRLVISSGPGAGTRVMLEAPLTMEVEEPA